MSELKPTILIKSPKRFQVQRQKLIEWQKREEEQTYAATEDELLNTLQTRLEIVIFKDGKEKTLARKYRRQVIAIILHHSKTGQVKDFIINESDLRSHLREELTTTKIGGTPKEYHKIVDEIFFNAVRRLFEELDLVYYQDHLAGRLRVRLVP